MASARWTAILAGILVCGLAHTLIPLTMLHVHNVVQHIYYLPIVFAGMYFGWQGGLASGLVAGISSLPYSLQLLAVNKPYAGDELMDIAAFCAAGAFTGFLADRERGHRRAMEETAARLAEVYRELQESVEQVKRAERLSAAGQLSAGLAHEIRNPLASLAGAASLLRRDQTSEQRRQECVEIILRECERVNRLLSQFLDFARPRAPQFRATDPRGLLEAVAQLGRHAIDGKRVAIRLELGQQLPIVECDPEQIQQALLNLVLNAIHASPESGEIVLSARAQDQCVAIEVRDEGPGIGEADRGRIFDPFFTTKDDGTGLGLSVVHQIVQQHGGTIEVEILSPRGTAFEMLLPSRRGSAK